MNMNEKEFFGKLFDEEMRTYNGNDVENCCKLYFKLYDGCKKAGFTSQESMDILKTLITGAIMRNQNG